MFCFALIFGLHWLSLGAGGRVSLLSYNAIRYLAFVAAPPLFMVLLLTTRPLAGLSLRWPPRWTWPAAVALAVLLLPPFSALTLLLLEQFPQIKQTLSEVQNIAASTGSAASLPFGSRLNKGGFALFVFVVLPAVCEELAFRGFILSGLCRRFRPWTAILLSSFLYALYQMNVLQVLPHFLLGIVLALLVLRSGSIGGAIVFRLVWESLLWGPLLLPRLFPVGEWLNGGVVLICLIGAAPLLVILRPPSALKSSKKMFPV